MSGKRDQFENFDTPISELDWMRMAAFIDGEGCIRAYADISNRRKYQLSPHYSLILTIGNTDPRMAEWCYFKFGGQMYKRKTRSPKHRPAYVWHANAKRAEAILRGCLPYFLLKQEQASLAIELRDTIDYAAKRTALTPEMIEKRNLLVKQIAELKTCEMQASENFRTLK